MTPFLQLCRCKADLNFEAGLLDTHIWRLGESNPRNISLWLHFYYFADALTVAQLDEMMKKFEAAAIAGTHGDQGWHNSTYSGKTLGFQIKLNTWYQFCCLLILPIICWLLFKTWTLYRIHQIFSYSLQVTIHISCGNFIICNSKMDLFQKFFYFLVSTEWLQKYIQ